MEEQATLLVEASMEYVGRWNRLITTTNWEKGRIICNWRKAMEDAGAPPSAWTDEAWSREVGNVTPQHVGRLRRVYERFGDVYSQYEGLYWSHFQAAIDWPDAEMYLQGAVDCKWSVAEMRNQRWEALGGPPEQKPLDSDITFAELDEDVSNLDDAAPPTSISESYGEVRDAGDFAADDFENEPLDVDGETSADYTDPAGDTPKAEPLRPFESLPNMPADVKEAFELFKLAIIAHKVSNWRDFPRDGVLAILDSLKQLALAPAE